ncbi:MAG: site-2 protease family protein [Roseiarcus sp.]|jgi:Zn-dependent protease/CBS domain-containing protein
MRWSLTIGRFGGTAVKIHVTFLLLLAWIGFSAWQQGGPAAAGDSLIFIILLFVCVVLHEFGHILVARRYGIQAPEVTLLPIGGVASLQKIPDRPSQEFAIAIAGPAVNFVIAIVLLLLVGSFDSADLARLDDPRVSLLARLADANLFLAIFNLIPAFPMDGGRVLRALLAMKLGRPRATRIAASVGQAFAFGLGFLGLFGNPLLIFIAIFIYVAATGEAQITAVHESARGLSVAEAMETRFASLPADARLADAVDALLATAQHEFPVVDGLNKPIGLVTREDIFAALKDQDRDAAVAGFMRAPIETLRAEAPLDTTVDTFLQQEAPAVCVVDRDGVLVGVLGRQNLAEMMMIKSMRPDWRFERARAGLSAE